VSAGNGGRLNPTLYLILLDFYWGEGGFSVHTNFKFSIHSNTAYDGFNLKDGKVIYKEIRFLEKVSNKWKLVGQTGHH
jgi:hypothetical protein